jgi:hypothetical protein
MRLAESLNALNSKEYLIRPAFGKPNTLAASQ